MKKLIIWGLVMIVLLGLGAVFIPLGQWWVDDQYYCQHIKTDKCKFYGANKYFTPLTLTPLGWWLLKGTPYLGDKYIPWK